MILLRDLVAGLGEAAYLDGLTTAAKFNRPLGLAFQAPTSQLFVADFYNCRYASQNLASLNWGGGQVTRNAHAHSYTHVARERTPALKVSNEVGAWNPVCVFYLVFVPLI